MHPVKGGLRFLAAVAFAGCVSGSPTGSDASLAPSRPLDLDWRANGGVVNASLTDAPLDRVLARVARATGWRVYLEPGVRRRVSARFSSLPQRKALRRLVGNLSYMLSPDTSGKGSRLYVYQSSAGAATERIEAEEDAVVRAEPGPIRTELIVRVKRGSKFSPEALAQKLGGRIVGRLDTIGAFRLRFDTEADAQDALAALTQQTEVATVENNVRLPPPEVGAPTDALPANVSLHPQLSGSRDFVITAIIDTAVQTLPSPYEQFIVDRRSVADGSDTASSVPTHGTVMVESFLQGVGQSDLSPDGTRVRVLTEDVYGGQPTTTTWQVTQGLIDAAARGATLFNLSLGGPQDSPLLADVISSLSSQGALVFAAAGNTPGTSAIYPASDPMAIGVTAVLPDGKPAPYADTGPQAKLAGPSATVVSYGGQYWMAQGTSGATAVVSGMAAGMASQLNLTPAQVQTLIFQRAAFQPPRSP